MGISVATSQKTILRHMNDPWKLSNAWFDNEIPFKNTICFSTSRLFVLKKGGYCLASQKDVLSAIKK